MSAGTASAAARPGTSRRTALVLMLVDFVLPVVLYYVLRAAGADSFTALLAGSLLPGASTAAMLLRERRIDSAGAFMLVSMLAGAGLALVTGDPRLLLLKGALLMAGAGTWFVVTARGDRPLSAAFSRPLVEGRVVPRGETWEDVWERSPAFRRVWRVSTVIWGAGALVNAAVRACVVLLAPIDLAVGLGPVQHGAFGVAVLVVLNVYHFRVGLYDRRSGLLGGGPGDASPR
ncbi:VC0807 family protein [Planomonospora parontospora]|uniref:VC0807 family protein n=1 Tax=Planomonospora parontospora TaxID=58119 RepID=UPI00166F9BCC|nr:VC0807 family protein [Planomonospora parontospora]GGL38405.1 hypothetical protein GCM10014719_44400 [Planomonospora parontospora subsp. antibiotica]GII17644.1 hypothetical protein Ppa05_43700 [Planomonospora parontospora subsp. antibiotica]